MPHKGRYTLEFADGRTQSLSLSGKALNRGAAGVIYRAPDGKTALKFYHELKKDQTRRNKVWQMIQHPPEDTHREHFAWPTALVLNSRGAFAGFAMPLLPVSSYVSLDLVLSARGRKMQALPQASAWRLDVAINLAKRVAELHAKGHCIIDLKPANLLVHRRSGDVAVVDCDGFAVQGDDQYYPANQFTAGFIAPEAFRAKQTPQALRQPQDSFALAVILFSLLNGGLHPYQGVPNGKKDIPSDNQNRIAGGYYPYGLQLHHDLKPSPWSVHQDFPRILRETFDHSFTLTKRPLARDWVTLLEQAKSRLKTCSRDPDHGYWGKQCPHCARAKTEVKVTKPRRKRPAPRPVHRATTPPTAQTQTPAPATSSGAAGTGTRIFLWIISIFAIGTMLGDGCSGSSSSSSSSYSPPVTTPIERAPVNPESLAWRDRGPALQPLYAANRSAAYARRSPSNQAAPADEQALEAIPFYRFGAFDQPEKLNLLTSQPRSSDFLGLAEEQVNLSGFDLLNNELSHKAQYPSLSAPYGLSFWQADPRPGQNGLYLPQCGPRSCDLLQRLSPDQKPANYELPEWETHNPFDGFPHWRYQLSPEGEFMVLASASQVAVFAVDQPKQPVAILDLPDAYSGFTLGSLSVDSQANSVILGVSKQERFGINFEAAVLELSRNGSQLSLDESFAEHARLAGTELLGAYQTLSHDGQTLAVSEYQQLENNSTDYTWLYNKVTVALGYPAISIWGRDNEGHWQLRQRIEWQGRRGSRKLQVTRPQQMNLLSGLSFSLSNSKIVSDGQVHQELQLSPDGSRLLSGLETDERRALTATSYLFDISGKTPAMLGRLSMTTRPGETGLKSAYPSVRMSNSGEHAVMGWFLHYENLRTLDQSMRVEVFALPHAASSRAPSPTQNTAADSAPDATDSLPVQQ